MVKVGLFTLLTVLAAVLLTRRPGLLLGAVAQGFTLPAAQPRACSPRWRSSGSPAWAPTSWPCTPTWCVEKGYARFTGPRDGSAGLGPPRARLDPGHARRHRGLDGHLHAGHHRLLPAGRRHPARHGPGAQGQRHDRRAVRASTPRRWGPGRCRSSTPGPSSPCTAPSSRPPPPTPASTPTWPGCWALFRRDDYAARVAAAAADGLGADPGAGGRLSPDRVAGADGGRWGPLAQSLHVAGVRLRHVCACATAGCPPEVAPAPARTTVALWVAACSSPWSWRSWLVMTMLRK